MPFQPPPRLPAAAASVLAAGLMLTAASCSHLTPLGPGPAAAMPQPHHLRSPLVLQDMRVLPPAPVGGCLAGYVALPGGASPGACYRRTGTPVTITSAGVSSVSSFRPSPPPGQQAVPIQYGFWITLPAADAPALAAVIPTAPGPPGPPTARVVTSAAAIPAVSLAGRTWVLIGFTTRFADRELEVFLPSRSQALQLQRMLAAPG
jgi:hypothetical protein